MYWQDRQAQGQAALTAKSERKIKKQLQKYYATAAKSVIAEFESTYQHLLLSIEEGRQPTPADLYKLEKYWEMVGKLRQSLNKLGEIEIEMLTRVFEENYFDIYYGLDLPVDKKFSGLSHDTVKHLINSVWCADGKTWSSRVWDNTGKLAEALNEELINTLLTGKKTTDLKNKLQDKFNASYAEADRLVRTELAHIQTVAAEQRYKDSGIEWAEVWADKDERQCEICGKLHKTKYRIGSKMPIPAHPNCRCCIVPVI
jgi:SPP1 gp7 family putative phage head morphogenesis protein